jgi:adenylate cyclase
MQRASRISIGVGLHTGRAVVGNIGSAQRMQYTAIGDTVNVAARLVSLAAPGQIIVSEEIRNSAEGSFAPLGEVELKGREQKMTAYSLLWDHR